MDWQGNDTGESYITSRQWRVMPRALRSRIVLAYTVAIGIAFALALCLLLLDRGFRSLFRF